MVHIQTLALLAASAGRVLSKVCASDNDYSGSLVLRQSNGGGPASSTMPGDRCLELKQWWRPCLVDEDDGVAGGRRLEELDASAGDEVTATRPTNHRTCDEWMAMVDDSATEETCFDSLILSVAPWEWYPIVRREWLAMLQPCCGTTPHACAEHTVNPCDDATTFKPLEKADNNSNTCALAAYALSQLGPFNTSQALCAAKVTWGAESELRVYSFVEQIAAKCCGGKSICSDWEPGADAAATRSMAPLLALLALAAACRPSVPGYFQ